MLKYSGVAILAMFDGIYFFQHQNHSCFKSNFTKRYNFTTIVYFELKKYSHVGMIEIISYFNKKMFEKFSFVVTILKRFIEFN